MCFIKGSLSMVDYKKFSLKKINDEEFHHIKYLLYWPFYGLMFLILERFVKADYHYMHSFFDDLIPFCEYFIIPYYFWFVYLIGMLCYTFFFDTKNFSKMMKYIIITYSAAIFIYIIYPNAQNLRPESFERDNVFTDIVKFLYVFDTNTNVCPSIHVLGSMAVMFASFECEKFKSFFWKSVFVICCVLISVSTVFLKQHSVTDIFAALILGIFAYPFAFKDEFIRKKRFFVKAKKEFAE